MELLTDTSVRVSWRQILADEITSYTVYYRPSDNTEQSEQLVTVPSSESSVVIEDLMTNMEYQFQVAATAELEEVIFPGQRSFPMQTLLGSLLTHPDTTLFGSPTPPPTTCSGKFNRATHQQGQTDITSPRRITPLTKTKRLASPYVTILCSS